MKWRLYSFFMEHSSIHQQLGLNEQSWFLSHNVSLKVIFLTNQQVFCKKQNLKKCCWDGCQNCKYELKLFVFSTLQQQSVVVKNTNTSAIANSDIVPFLKFFFMSLNKFFLPKVTINLWPNCNWTHYNDVRDNAESILDYKNSTSRLSQIHKNLLQLKQLCLPWLFHCQYEQVAL